MARHKVRSADADRFLQQMVEVINEGLLRDRVVKIKGFGTFKLLAVKERASVNVQTGEKVLIGEHDKVTFTPDSVMKEIINKPFSQFETVVIDDDSPLLKEGGLPEDLDDAEEELEVQEVQEVQEVSEVSEASEASEVQKVQEVSEVQKVQEEVVVPEEISENQEAPEVQVSPVMSEVTEIPVSSVMSETPEAAEAPKEPVAVKETIEVKAEKIMVVADSVTVVAKDVKDEAGSQATSDTGNEDSTEDTSEASTDASNEEPTENFNEESTLETNEESTEKSTLETSEEMEEKKCKYCGALKYAAIAIVFFALGYLAGAEGLFSSLGRRTAMIVDSVKVKRPVILPDTTATDDAEEEAAEVASVENTSKTADNTTTAAVKPETKETTKPETKETAKPVTKETTKPETKETAKPETKETAKPATKETAKPAADKPLTQYNKDFRVKTGAYYIIGTETEVTVQKGQTLRSISKAYLGPGMECYVEAYNGTKEVKAGQKIKIPKLKMKKLKK